MPALRLTLGAVVAAVVVVTTPGAAPAAARPSARLASADATCPSDPMFGVRMRGDLDGDLVSDVVVGIPTERSSAGAVDLHLSTAPSMRLTRDSVAGFGTARAGDRFGAAVGLGDDVSGDGCPDLAIGAPGERGTGAVHLVLGGPGGPSSSGGLTIRGPQPRAGDRFGAAVAMSRHDLWVGAPGRAVAGHEGAGAVYHYAIERLATGLAARLLHVLTQASPGIAGAPEAGDHFGSALASDGPNALIGVPDEDVGEHRDAGLVQTLVGVADPTGELTARFVHERAFTQGSPDVPGAPEAGDHFGASLALTGFPAFVGYPVTAIIGIPGEDIGWRRDAGAVQLLEGVWEPGNTVSFVPAGLVLQGSEWSGLHIAGSPEAGDRFGAAVATAWGLFGTGEPEDILVGAPGEDIAGLADAGSVTVFGVGGPCEDCPGGSRVAYRGHGLPGQLRAGDAVGATVGSRTSPHYDANGEYLLLDGELVAGAPGSPVDGVEDVGEALLPGTALPPLADPRAGLRYGGVMGRGSGPSW